MKWWLVFPIFLLAVVQTTMTSFNFLLILLLILALMGLEAEGIAGGFIAGFFLDISTNGTLGTSGIAYLICLFPVLLYQRRFHSRNPVYWMILFFGASCVFNLVTQKGWQLWQALGFAGIALVLYFAFRRLELVTSQDDGIRLKV